MAALPPPDHEEASLIRDPRLAEAIARFNAGDWYACHDGFEELWHETAGPLRPVLQGILQIAVGQLHLERGNRRGATILTGEGLGRLRSCGDQALGLDLEQLRGHAAAWLQALQNAADAPVLDPPRLNRAQGHAL
ncbi:DUF309 domain-containing protein [Cyanobium sp. PCC 7001]|uniref:DUF309 domain-containing protein n=1 Tax=Cyanobium sp. PCC 7001 TaxID=180281 RepID=UPI000300BCFB|nr:DUF309 domain-containing protein [Cyanobium sp. PCC 7001]